MKKQLMYRAAAATVLGLSLTTGVAAAQTPNHMDNHHGNTNNSLTAGLSANVSNVGVTNTTTQNSISGDASVSGGNSSSNKHHQDSDDSNTSTGNKAQTGNTLATNTTNGTVNVTQTPATAPTPSNTQGDSDHGTNNSADLSASVNVSNVSVTNTTNQDSYSGNATVTGNNSAGSAMTGDTTASNSSTFTIGVKQ